MVMPNLVFRVLFAALVGLAGCNDAHAVNPYPRNWLIDDFEDPNDLPTDHSFERWGCQPLDEEHPIRNCDITAETTGASGRGAVLHLGAKLYSLDLKNSDLFTRAEVATYAPKRPLDLTAYATFKFSAALSFTYLPTPNYIGLKAQFVCPGAEEGGADFSPNPSVVATCDWVQKGWQDCLIPLTRFGYSDDSPGRIDRSACLAQVEGIKITVDSNQPKTVLTSAVEFDLYLDDIELVP